MSNDELYHYGVPGMKWGERKASSKSTQTRRPTKKKGDDQKKKNNQSTNNQQQNTNKPTNNQQINNKPTTNNSQQNVSKQTTNQPNKPTIDINKIKNKKVSDMSNEELKVLNERQQLEETHRRLNPSKIAKGLAIVGAVAAALGTVLALYKNSKALVGVGKEIMQKHPIKKANVESITNNVKSTTPKTEISKNTKSGKLSTNTFMQKLKSATKLNTSTQKVNPSSTTGGHKLVGMTAIKNYISKHPSTGVSSLNKSTVNSGQSLVQSFLKKYPKRTLTSV